MTNMDPHESFLHFGIVVLAICVPTFLLVGIINYKTFQKTVAYLAWPVVWTIANTKKSMDWAHQYRDKYMWMTWKRKEEENRRKRVPTRAQTFANLHHRLSMERAADQGPKVSGGGAKGLVEKQATDSDVSMMAPELLSRESTVKWDVPATTDEVRMPEPSPNTIVPDLSKAGIAPVAGRRTERPLDRGSPRRSLLRRLSARMGNDEARCPV